MIETMNVVMPVVIEVLIAILLFVSIILVIRCILLVNGAKKIVDNVNNKINSFNGIFSIIHVVSDKISELSDTVASFFESLISRIIRKKDDEIESDDE